MCLRVQYSCLNFDETIKSAINLNWEAATPLWLIIIINVIQWTYQRNMRFTHWRFLLKTSKLLLERLIVYVSFETEEIIYWNFQKELVSSTQLITKTRRKVRDIWPFLDFLNFITSVLTHFQPFQPWLFSFITLILW